MNEATEPQRISIKFLFFQWLSQKNLSSETSLLRLTAIHCSSSKNSIFLTLVFVLKSRSVRYMNTCSQFLKTTLSKIGSSIWFFNVPFGEWEKIPRLKAKTLVGLRYYEKLSQDIPFGVWHQVSFRVDNEIPQADACWKHWHTVTWFDTRNM